MIPYGKQEITEDDIDAVVEVLRSELITQGPVLPKFENALAQYCRVKNVIAVSSGTTALHIACLAMGLGPGDWLWTSPISFLASANCGVYCGAEIDFVDIDPQTRNMSVDALRRKLRLAEQEGKLPKIVVPVHFSGLPCDMREIRELANYYGFYILEDACHALGASYQNKPVGSCHYSDVTVFSFHPVKNITTGEGGAATTNNKDLADKMRCLRIHGITRDPDLMLNEPDGEWYYEQIELGYNYRMTDIQAALGLSQMDRLDTYIATRSKIAHHYDELLDPLPVLKTQRLNDRKSAWHLYVIEMEGKNPSEIRKHVFDKLRDKGWGVNVHYFPIHKQPFYKQRFLNGGLTLEAAERYYERAITIPLYPQLSKTMQEKFVKDISLILSGKR